MRLVVALLLLAPAAQATPPEPDLGAVKPDANTQSRAEVAVAQQNIKQTIAILTDAWGRFSAAMSRPLPGAPIAARSAHRPALHLIPAGTFEMGSPDRESPRIDDEIQHTVTLTRPFLMMRTEVTQRQWSALMGNEPSFFADRPDAPVERVNWFEAVAFANALSKVEGLSACYTLTDCRAGYSAGDGCGEHDELCAGGFECTVQSHAYCAGYRLPTEAEWEYAARAGATASRHGAAREVSWYAENSGGVFEGGDNVGGKTQAVGRKTPNAWGLHDMLGNVQEWTGDWQAAYPDGSVVDPKGPESGEWRVYRGGSWLSNFEPRFAARSAYLPDQGGRAQGLRLIRVTVESSAAHDL